MGVVPGAEHQAFLQEVYKKIIDLREFNKNIIIQVDGWVNFQVAANLKDVGVNIINSGSLVSDSTDPKRVINELEKI